MSNIDKKIPINDLIRQNPWWQNEASLAEDPAKSRRDIYPEIYQKITGNELITAITGLRRIGKTTIIKQIINELLSKTDNKKTILYYSFEEANLALFPSLLESIIEYQIRNIPKGKIYFFFDEIQYVNFWNAVLKKYVDLEPRLKFIITGSSSLFIKTGARESLAGRILEVVMYPLIYGEYLRLVKGIPFVQTKSLIPADNSLKKEILSENFYDYLTFGEFPYLPKLTAFEDQKQYILDWVISKVVESDLPRIRRFVDPSILANLAGILISGSGQLIELTNLARDLAVDRKTLSTYLTLLENSRLITTINNLGVGFRSRHARQRKIYSASVNAVVYKNTSGQLSDSFNLKIGQIIENYVLNYFKQKNIPVFFWKKRDKEIDFILETANGLVPVEVKYQSKIRNEDTKNIVSFCQKEKLSDCWVITRDILNNEKRKGISVHLIPVYYLI